MTLDNLFEDLINSITEERFEEIYSISAKIKEEIRKVSEEKVVEKENSKILELEKRVEKLEKIKLSSHQISKEVWIDNIWQ